MLTFVEKIAFIVAVIASAYFSYKSFSIMIKVINRGEGKLHFDNIGSRIIEALSVFFSQKTVLKKRPFASFAHSLVAWAFILYMLVNVGDVLQAYMKDFHFLGKGTLGNYYRLFTDIFSVFALVGMSLLITRRFIVGSKVLTIRENVMLSDTARKGVKKDSLIVGIFILSHIGFRFLGESFNLAKPGHVDEWQPLATAVSHLWTSFSPETLTVLFHVSWWIALGLILAFLPYFPSSKHAHLFMGPINFLTRPERTAPGTMDYINMEDEEIEQFGVANLEHLEKTQILDAYACIMCNRCQDVCPAYLTGKELSPSALEVNKRYFINENKEKLAAGEEVESIMTEFALTESALWACTSCAACVNVCPVGNEPMLDILNMRRDKVLMESEFPAELEPAFNGMETNENPWNMNEDRMKWAKDDETLDVKTVEENPDFDVLFWVGCAGAFEEKGQGIARSFAKIMNKADINFAVLGNNESCTGDSARRAGNEYLFYEMATNNVETLNSANVKKIVATCPHCLHTLKNEYPQFGGNYEVVHHTEFINQLIDSRKISPNNKVNEKVTFHDPCYLGRHNNVIDEPRKDLQACGSELVEMDRHGENSFCCSAGGAQMWKEEEEGDEAIRRVRFQEAQKTGADVIGTACPFCMTMMQDAGKELESDIKIKDIAEIVANSLD
jgi:Fe-S oxidoreductase